MDKHLAIALIYASKSLRKTLKPLFMLDELTPELIEELKKLKKELVEWSF